MKSVMIIAGEASGDLYGAYLVKALRDKKPDLKIIGAGGTKMRSAGAELVAESAKFSTVGVMESLQKLPIYARLYRLLLSALNREKPDCVVLIDSPEFNLRFAERVKERNIPVVYYVSPQVWAWRPGRVKKIAKLVRKMLVILEFEKEIYQSVGVDVKFVGHPLLDIISDIKTTSLAREPLGIEKERFVIGLLPGSRYHEFKRLFRIMLQSSEIISKHIRDVKFIVACAEGITPELTKLDKKNIDIEFVWNKTYEVMMASDFLIVASGTATLETAIIGKPMVVVYKFNPLTVLPALLFVKVKNYSLVNIVAGRKIVPECYQWRATPKIIAQESLAILDSDRFETIKTDLLEIKKRLGNPGASHRSAEEILALL
jgi:lipid-A-disaccharide synthase